MSFLLGIKSWFDPEVEFDDYVDRMSRKHVVTALVVTSKCWMSIVHPFIVDRRKARVNLVLREFFFILSFIHMFIYSFIHSYVHSSIYHLSFQSVAGKDRRHELLKGVPTSKLTPLDVDLSRTDSTWPHVDPDPP